MKKFNLKTGIPFSILVSIITVLLRLLRAESTDFFLAYYYFIFSLLCWMGNVILINTKLVSMPVYKRRLFYFLSIIAGGLFCIFFDYLNTLLRGYPISVSELYDISPGKRMVVLLVRGGLLNLLNAFFVSHLKQMKDHEDKKVEIERLKQNLLQANLSSLKEQLSPHFLFNSFNTLNHLTKEDRVKDFVNEMANVYRYLLDYQKKDLADLKQELDFAKSYLFIIQTRLEDALQVDIKIEPEAGKYSIPPLTLQLLIENAIKHNVATRAKPLNIQIFTDNEFIVVSNNVQPKTASQPSSGIGLNNISQRYELLFHKEIQITVNEKNFTVKLPLAL